jgi:uncharacterized protein
MSTKPSGAEVLEALSRETEGAMRLKLIWNAFEKSAASQASRYVPRPNDPQIQWEAMIESLKASAVQEQALGVGSDRDHDCHHLSMLRVIFWQECDNIKAATSDYIMTLHKAAEFGLSSVVRLLLEANADDDGQAADGHTSLHIACFQGHKDVVEAQLRANAATNARDKSGRTPLFLAAQENHADICKMLLNANANPNSHNDSEWSPLLDAAVRGHVEVVNVLLAANVYVDRPMTICNTSGLTAVHLAAELGYLEVVKAMLNAGAQIDHRASYGNTPLQQAAINGHTETVRLLLEAGADSDAEDSDGVTASMFAL